MFICWLYCCACVDILVLWCQNVVMRMMLIMYGMFECADVVHVWNRCLECVDSLMM